MIDSDIHRKLHDYLCKFLNRIPDNDFNIIWDMLLFKTTMKTKQSLKELNRTEKTYLYVQGLSFSINDRHYRELLDVLYKYYKEKSTIKDIDSIDVAISLITPDHFIENTSYIIYKFCRPPYSAKLEKLFGATNVSSCLNDETTASEKSDNIDTKEQNMKYYIGYIEKRKNFYNFKPEFVFDGSKLSKGNFTDEFPPYGTFNMAYKRYKKSEDFIEHVLINDLYAVNSERISVKENRSNIDNTLIDAVQKQIDLQSMCDEGVDLSEIIFPAQKLDIYKIAFPSRTDLSNDLFIDGTIQIQDDDNNPVFIQGDRVFLLLMNKLYGPYSVLEKPKTGEKIVRPDLGSKEHKYIRQYIDCVETERIFSFSISIDFYNSKKISCAHYLKEKIKCEDIIPDEVLLAELNNIYNIHYDSKTTFDRLIKDSELLTSKLPVDVQQERVDRLKAQFETFESLSDYKKTVITTLAKADWSRIEGINSILSEKLKQLPEYLALNEKCVSLQQEIERVTTENDAKDRRINELEEQNNQERLNQQNNEATYEQTEELVAQKDQLEQEIEQLKVQVSDWTAIVDLDDEINKREDKLQNLKDDIERKQNTIDTKYSDLGRLDIKIENAKKNFEQTVKDAITKAADPAKIAFDPVVSNIMLEEASKLQSNQTESKYKNYCESVNALAEKSTPLGKELIDYLVDGVRKYRKYSYEDIINMYICVAQGFLTIFAGEPGTGKTSMCNLIAASLGLMNSLDSKYDEIRRYVPISVERGWSSKRDLIGYYNPLSKKYDKSNGKIYDALRVLDIERDNSRYPVVILLDEANLSPIEYYWAEFMRVADRSSETAMIDIGETKDIYIPETLSFVATINYDQTTEELSPRLIDRSWIIKLPNVEMDYNEKPKIEDVFTKNILWSDIKNVFYPTKEDTVKNEDVLNQIYEEFAKAGLSVSYRVKKSIYEYVEVAQRLMRDDQSGNAENLAIDYAVMQKLLPKINGNEFKLFLDRLNRICETNRLSKTKQAISVMLEQAENNLGYCQYL